MILHNSLTPHGLVRLMNQYFTDRLTTGLYHFEGRKLMVELNYKADKELFCLGEIRGVHGENPFAKAALVDYLIMNLGGN